MLCSNCGYNLEADEIFCQKCGTRVASSDISDLKGSFIDQRDGMEYKTVKIGEHIWMAENLAYDAEGSRYCLNSYSFKKKLGRLYNWDTAMAVCPPGWHLPDELEWGKLMEFAGGAKIAGKRLKVKSVNGTDDFGFNARLGGDCHYEYINEEAITHYSGELKRIESYEGVGSGYYVDIKSFSVKPPSEILATCFENYGKQALFWSSYECQREDEQSSAKGQALAKCMSKDSESFDEYFYPKTHLLSVRCIKDY